MFEYFVMGEEGNFRFCKSSQRQQKGVTNRKQVSEKNWSG